MNDNQGPHDTLAARTIATVRAFFAEKNHRPSEEHWDALEDIATTLEDMADDACDAKTYLSAIDAGTGKTTVVTHFARSLIEDARYMDVGMVICVGRIEETKSVAHSLLALGIDPSRFAVRTTDPEANALGNAGASEAQVLITTQQGIERACEGRTFASVETFHYRGNPRKVRAWDEALLPATAMTITSDDLFGLLKPLRAVSPAFSTALKKFADAINELADGDAIDVPDFEAEHHVSLWDLVMAPGGSSRLSDDQRGAAKALRTLCGRRARVRRDDAAGNAILTYKETLPADLVPILVLDASGRIGVRATYGYMDTHRGSLLRLKEAVKDYSPLEVFIWRTSGSKSGFERNGDGLVAGIADLIKTKPQERWLIVTHKPDRRVKDVSAKLHRALPKAINENVQTITWGSHMATNLYGDVPNVVLAGTLFMRPSQYTALTHAAQDLDVAHGLAPAEDVERIVQGEHANLILQALCRGRVRKSDGAKCLPMSAYVIASTISGIPAALADIFPGCTVKTWRGAKLEMTTKQEAAMRFIGEALRTSEWVSYRDVASGIGAKDWANFRKLVVDHRNWSDAIADSPFEEAVSGPRNARGVRLKVRSAIALAA